MGTQLGEIVGDAENGWTQEGPVIACTRLRFTHWWIMLIALVRFHALYRRTTARSDAGPLRGAVAVENPWTLLNISVWQDTRTLLLWSGGDEHVAQVRWTYVRTTEVWSALGMIGDIRASARSWHGDFMAWPPDERRNVRTSGRRR